MGALANSITARWCPVSLIVGFCLGVAIMSIWIVLASIWCGIVERVGMWYVVIKGGKPKPVYATKPPHSEGEVISGHEDYADAIRSADELRRKQSDESPETR